jgi:hypothetical protein
MKIVKRTVRREGTAPAAPQPAKSSQLRLFEEVFSGAERSSPADRLRYTNSFQLYDLAPKAVSPERAKELRVKAATGERYLRMEQREFEIDGRRYRIELRPARLRDRDGLEYEAYPGTREDLVEKAIRRIAINQRRTEERDRLDKETGKRVRDIGLRFRLSEVRRELTAHGHGFKLSEIQDAIHVLGYCNMTIWRLDGAEKSKKPECSGNMFPFVGMAGAEDFDDRDDGAGDRDIWISFNSLVAADIDQMRYRQLDYKTNMGLNRQVARWLHERLTHAWTWAMADRSLDVLGSTIMRDSGMKDYSQPRDAFRHIESSLTLLIEKGVLERLEIEERRGPRNRLEDVLYKLFPSADFVKEMKAANWRDRQLPERLQQFELERLSQEGRAALAEG